MKAEWVHLFTYNAASKLREPDVWALIWLFDQCSKAGLFESPQQKDDAMMAWEKVALVYASANVGGDLMARSAEFSRGRLMSANLPELYDALRQVARTAAVEHNFDPASRSGEGFIAGWFAAHGLTP